MEYSPSRRDGVSHCYRFPNAPQDHLICSLERYQLSCRSFPSHELSHHHRLRDMATSLRRSTPATTMLAWQVWIVYRLLSIHVPAANLVLRFVSQLEVTVRR